MILRRVNDTFTGILDPEDRLRIHELLDRGLPRALVRRKSDNRLLGYGRVVEITETEDCHLE